MATLQQVAGLWFAICFLLADATSFWTVHILSEYFTGPANKDTGNEECDVGFIAFYCFGQQTKFSDFNSEEHVDNTVLEWVQVEVNNWGQYLSCCPPHSKTNTAGYYRCNTWTNEDNDNCHTLNLPWNDGKVKAVGAQIPAGSKKVSGKDQWMYSFPSEGEGTTWRQGLTRRIKMSTLAQHWIQAAGGCQSCQGKDLEDPCYGKCVSKLGTPNLIALTNQAQGDLHNFPNYGIPGQWTQGIVLAGTNKCMDLSGGNSAYGTAIDLWDCNGLVNQAWYWKDGDYQIQLAGHNLPGMCIDVPGGKAANGVKLWIWGCTGSDNQKWLYDQSTQTIRFKKNPKFCIDVPGGNNQNGNHLWIWQCSGHASQKWKIYRSKVDLGVHTATSQARRGGKSHADSWMHRAKKWLSANEMNWTKPANWVPWYEKKDVKDWYAAQMPGPGLPRHLVPEGWQGYNISTEPVNIVV